MLAYTCGHLENVILTAALMLNTVPSILFHATVVAVNQVLAVLHESAV